MNRERIKGAFLLSVGKIQERAGYAIGNKEQQAKGVARQIEGTTLRKMGAMKDESKHMTHR